MENRQISLTEDQVALQGTIETFALPDVMQLLASTRKTGLLRLEGSRGTGSIWVDSGEIVGGAVSSAPHAAGAVEVVFELLRFKDGDFVFDADETTDSPSSPAEVASTLAEAEAMLEEWKSIEAVIPSLASWVTLSTALPQSEVVISGDTWELIVAVAGGVTVGELGDRFSLAEMAVSKRVKELVEAGLGEVGEIPEEALSAAPRVNAPAAAPAPAPAPEPVLGGFDEDVASEPESDDSEDIFDPGALVVDLEPLGAADDLEGAEPEDESAEAVSVDSPTDAAEIARQLANLSPKAARAVAAAARATTAEERDLALADVDEEEESINRDLLIKFLGSVSG